MTWHVGETALEMYRQGALDEVAALSTEAHFGSCDSCRQVLNAGIDPEWRDTLWLAVRNAVDRPAARPGEVLLTRLGVRQHLARLLVLTPAARPAGVLAVLAVLAFSLAASRALLDTRSVFLVLAPVAPVAGVALAYGRRIDPLYEVNASTPAGGFHLLLVRSTVVLVVSICASGLASLAVPEIGGSAVWLLPSFALTLLALVLSTRVTTTTASAIAAASWLAGVIAVAGPFGSLEVAFGSGAQAAFAAATVVLATILAVRVRSSEPR